VRELCRDVDAAVVDPRGIRISGGRIRGVLDLSHMTVTCPLSFEGTAFDEQPVMDRSRIPTLGFIGCELPGLSARDAQIDHEFTARRSLVGGSVDLSGIGAGSVVWSGASITVGDGVALSLDRAEVRGSVFLDEVFQATGELWLRDARIKGRLQCSGTITNRKAILENRGAIAVSLEGAEVGGGVFLGRGGEEFRATGVVRMIEIRITGQLSCEGATLGGATLENGDRIALWLDGAQVDGSVYLNGAFRAEGEVRMLGARITGPLDCRGATIENIGRSALELSRAEVAGGVYLDPDSHGKAFQATGEVRMEGARIDGPLSCRGATLDHAGKDVLVLDKAEVGGVFLELARLSGEVRMDETRIMGPLRCRGATIDNAGKRALVLDRAEVAGGVLLDADDDGVAFRAKGDVRMREAHIMGTLSCSGATLLNQGADALSLERARIDGSFRFRDVTVRGGVNLRHARAATLEDDLDSETRGSWAGATPLVLDGFVYEPFGPSSPSNVSAAQGDSWERSARREWLQSTTQFEPRAWSQLASVYRAQGRDGDAASTLIAMHNEPLRRRELSPRRSPHRWAGRWILRVTIGHGYRPWYALGWAAVVISAFAVIVWKSSEHFEPAKTGVGTRPQPILYAIDVFLPIVDVFQSDWRATGWASWVTFVVVLLGWALTTLFVAGFTRIVRT